MVKLKDSRELTQRNITAITMLVARAVEGLEPQSVTVLDMEGNLLDLDQPTEDRQRDEAALVYRKQIQAPLPCPVRRCTAYDFYLISICYAAGMGLAAVDPKEV